MVVNRVSPAEVETPSAREVISFTATSGSTVTGLTRGLAGTSDATHAVGSVVEFSPDVIWAQSVYDALTATVVASTGVLDTTKVVSPSDTQTLFNKMISGATLSSPTFVGFSTIATLSLLSPMIDVAGTDAVGDMYYRGVGGYLTRLAVGTTGQYLSANASLPVWASLSAGVVKVGNFTRDLSAATGSVAYTGVGFTPKTVIFLGAAAPAAAPLSMGFSDGTTHGAIYNNHPSSSNTFGEVDSACILLQPASGAYQTASVSSLDADGFTLSWTKTGSPTGTNKIHYLAIG